MANDPNSLMAQATCIDCAIPDGAKLAVLISVFANLAGMSTDPNSLMAQAKCYQCIPPGAQMSVLIYLATQISGGGAGGGVTTGNYGGAQPSFTPTGAGAVAIDTSNGRIWWYYNGQWN